MASLETAVVTVGENKYDIVLLNVKEALDVEADVINLFTLSQQGKVSGALIYSLAKTLLNGAEVNGKQIDIDTHFSRKVGELNKVVFACLKENFPDFFEQMSGSFMKQIQTQFGSVKNQSE